jgi:hypothetical protein
VRTFDKRAGTGEKKGCKRMAETGCVFDVTPGQPRTPEQVMRPDPGATTDAPRAQDRWYACDITSGRDVTIGKIFDQADRRDPGHARTWIALVDGDIYQLGLIQAAAAARGITLTILVDFIHVLEYLWKTAWCFHPPRDPAMEDWVIARHPRLMTRCWWGGCDGGPFPLLAPPGSSRQASTPAVAAGSSRQAGGPLPGGGGLAGRAGEQVVGLLGDQDAHHRGVGHGAERGIVLHRAEHRGVHGGGRGQAVREDHVPAGA